MSRKMWEVVETKARKIGVEKTKRRRKERGGEKETREERTEKEREEETKTWENDGSQEDSRSIGDLRWERCYKLKTLGLVKRKNLV